MRFIAGHPELYSVPLMQSSETVVNITTSPKGNVMCVLTQLRLQFWSAMSHPCHLSSLSIPKCSTLPGHDIASDVIWHPQGRMLAVVTLDRRVLFFEADIVGKNDTLVVTDNARPNMITMVNAASRVCFSDQLQLDFGIIISVCSSAKCLLVTTSGGFVVVISWNSMKVVHVLGSRHFLTKRLNAQPQQGSHNPQSTSLPSTTSIPKAATTSNNNSVGGSNNNIGGSIASTTTTRTLLLQDGTTRAVISTLSGSSSMTSGSGSSGGNAGGVSITYFTHHITSRRSCVLFSDGSLSLLSYESPSSTVNGGGGGGAANDFLGDQLVFSSYRLNGIEASRVSINGKHSMIVVARRGTVQFFRIVPETNPDEEYSNMHTPNNNVVLVPLTAASDSSGVSWMSDEVKLGPISQMEWSGDEENLVVAFEKKGIMVLDYAGVCLVSSFPRYEACRGGTYRPLLPSGCVSASWDTEGCRIWCAEPDSKLFMSCRMAKLADTSDPHSSSPGLVVLREAEGISVLHVSDSEGIEDNWEYVRAPIEYIRENYPLTYCISSPDGNHVACAGLNGCALYNRNLKRWRLFGAKREEKAISCIATPCWMQNICIALPVRNNAQREFQIVIYPRFHLDAESLLATIALTRKPVLVACNNRVQSDSKCVLAIVDSGNTLLVYEVIVACDSVITPRVVNLSFTCRLNILLQPPFHNPLKVSVCPVGARAMDAFIGGRGGGRSSGHGMKRCALLPPFLILRRDHLLCLVDFNELLSQYDTLAHRKGGYLSSSSPAASQAFHQQHPGGGRTTTAASSSAPAARYTIVGGCEDIGDMHTNSSSNTTTASSSSQTTGGSFLFPRRSKNFTMNFWLDMSSNAIIPFAYFVIMTSDISGVHLHVVSHNTSTTSSSSSGGGGGGGGASPPRSTTSATTITTPIGGSGSTENLNAAMPSVHADPQQHQHQEQQQQQLAERIMAYHPSAYHVLSSQVTPFDIEATPLGILPLDGFVVYGGEGVSRKALLPPDVFPLFQVNVKPILYQHRLLLPLFVAESCGGGSLVVTKKDNSVVDVAHVVVAENQQLHVTIQRLRENGSFADTMDYLLNCIIHRDSPFLIDGGGVHPLPDKRLVLRSVLALLRKYPEYYEVVIGCVRKVDVSKWRAIFDIIGSPFEFFNECVESSRVREAAQVVRVILMDKPEDTKASLEAAVSCARRLFSVVMSTASSRDFSLAYELVRFMSLLSLEIDLPPVEVAHTPSTTIERALRSVWPLGGPSTIPPQQHGTTSNVVVGTVASGSGDRAREAVAGVVGGGSSTGVSGKMGRHGSFAKKNSSLSGSTNNNNSPASCLRSLSNEPNDHGSAIQHILHKFPEMGSETIELASHLLKTGFLAQFCFLFEVFALDLSHFISCRWKALQKEVHLQVVFDNLHVEFGIPRAASGEVAKPSMDGIDVTSSSSSSSSNDTHVLQPSMEDVSMWLGGSSSAIGGSSILLCHNLPYITESQEHLLIVKPTFDSIHSLWKLFTFHGCDVYVLALSVLLLRVDTMKRIIRDTPTLGKELKELITMHRDNSGYRHVLLELFPSV